LNLSYYQLSQDGDLSIPAQGGRISMVKRIAATCALCLCAAPVWAVDDGIYAGGGIGQSQITATPLTGAPQIDDEDTSFRFFIGYRTMEWFAVELGYVDFGGVDTTFIDPTLGNVRLDVDASGFDAQAIGLLKFEKVDLYAKAGLILWNVDTRGRAGSGLLTFDRSFSDDGTDLVFGAGVKYSFLERWAVRLEYENFAIDGLDDDVGMISAGITWTWF
jgi:OmpA-OmpF porin, OOP family